MSAEMVHTFIRLFFVVVATGVGAVCSRSLFMAYRDDYGFPKRKGVNGRSRVDMAVLRREIMFGIALILSLVSAIRRTMLDDETPINWGSLLVTLFLFIFAATYLDMWLAARKERLNYGKGNRGRAEA